MKANMLPVASNFISIAKGCKRILQISDSQIVKYQKSRNVNPLKNQFVFIAKVYKRFSFIKKNT